jgi:Tol biopolymer transport system component
VLQEVSANQSYIWLADVASGEKKLLTPKGADEVAYDRAVFSKDGKGLYATTDRDSEFQRLAYFDLATMQPTYLTTEIKWDVDEISLSDDGKSLAFVTNEDGVSKLYLLNAATRKYQAVAGIPSGLIAGLRFHKNGKEVGFSLNSAKSPSDVYSLEVATGKVERWTFSEAGGLNTASFGREEVSRQAPSDHEHPWRTGRPVPAWFSGTEQFLPQRTGSGAGVSQCAWLDRLRQDLPETG